MINVSADVSSFITALTTIVYTIGTFMLWRTTTRTTKVVEEQLRSQINSNLSLAHHSVVDGHRDIFLEIIKDKDLKKLMAKEVSTSEDEIERIFLASILINHALRIFLDYKRSQGIDQSISYYNSDVIDLFSIPFVRERWEVVKNYHPPVFRNYIEDTINRS